MFLQVSVCPRGGGGGGEGVCLSACWDARPPPAPGRHTPRDQADPPRPGRPPQDQAVTPLPPRTRQTPPWIRQNPPRTRQNPPPDQAEPPPPEADSSIRSTSGRYASFWNAFLFYQYISRQQKQKLKRIKFFEVIKYLQTVSL